ncbi:hypothetical protein [Sphingomonas sp. MS122]|uniref:hypothetical protein n=1 Tax=Sphingomonas sp. MS122 TaxID=3412683 RepID=UPI003C2D4E3E
MDRLHLPARVPSAGAHRLLWWLLGSKKPAVRARRLADAAAALGPNKVERLLAGDLEPGWDMGATLRNVTGGYVTPEDFQRRRARRWWFDKPFDFSRVN